MSNELLVSESTRHHSTARPQDTNGRRLRRPSWTLAWRSPITVLALAVLVIALAWALVPGLFTRQNPIISSQPALLPPSAENWFGTDAVGRDLFARVVHGARQSLAGALVAVTVGVVFGTLLGVLAGARGGWVDTALMRLVDVLLAIPALLLSLSVIIVLGFGTINAAIAVGITTIAMFARLVRSRVLSVAASDYVEAAYGSGASQAKVLWRHVLPNSLTPVLAMAALQFGNAVLQLSTLGFLGYGAPPPTPEWGVLIADSRDYLATSWWLTVLPGLVVIAVVLATNHLSHVIQQEADR